MTGWVVQTLAATTALMAALLIVRRPAARILGARAAYALWLLPALRMVMPAVSAPLAPLWRVAHSGSVLAEAAARQPGMVFIVARVQAIIAGTATQLVPIQGALLAAWLGGAVLWFAWQMLHYACFMTGALRHADAASGRIRGIRVLYTTGVSGPAAAGILRKFVFLPADFAARYTVAERSLALLHEAVHHRRHDLAANVVALIVFALHWWNPVAHRAYRAYRADQELACDATVLLRLSKAGRHTYGSAMLKSAANHVPGAACALNNKDEIRRRLLGLACEPVSPSRRAFAGLATVLAMVSGLAATIGFAPAAHHERTASFHSATEAIAVRYNRRSPMPRFETATDSCRLPPLHYRGLCRSIGRHTVKFYDI